MRTYTPLSNYLIIREERLGCHGVDEIKNHSFFENDLWTFDTIRQGKQTKLLVRMRNLFP